VLRVGGKAPAGWYLRGGLGMLPTTKHNVSEAIALIM